MIRGKKAIVGKIILILLMLILIAGIILGITAYQAYSFYKSTLERTSEIQEEAKQVQDMINSRNISNIPLLCEKETNIEKKINSIKTDAEEVCKNPLIKKSIEKIEQIPVKCSNLDSLTNQADTQLKPIKDFCTNSTLQEEYMKQYLIMNNISKDF